MLVLLALSVLALWYAAKRFYGLVDEAESQAFYERTTLSKEPIAVTVAIPNAEIAGARIAAKREAIQRRFGKSLQADDTIRLSRTNQEFANHQEYLEELHKMANQEHSVQIANRWFLYGQETKAQELAAAESELSADLWNLSLAIAPVCAGAIALEVGNAFVTVVAECCHALTHTIGQAFIWLASIAGITASTVLLSEDVVMDIDPTVKVPQDWGIEPTDRAR